MIPSICTKTII